MDKKILDHFRKHDPQLHAAAIRLVKNTRPIIVAKKRSENYFLELCDIIVGQQLSGAAADTIFARFKKLYLKEITPRLVFNTDHEKLRSVGLSNSKANYLKNLALHVLEKKLDLASLDSLSDEEIKINLTQIKGIGPWTSEMFLMFTLGRPDIFSYGDLGLKKGIKKIYGFKKDPSERTMKRIISKWSPYKTYASLILWRSLE